MTKIDEIADAADMIINGYALTKCDSGYRILNLNHPDKATVMTSDGEVLETTMDDIELHVVADYLKRNLKLMEA